MIEKIYCSVLLSLLCSLSLMAQVEKLYVETYYITDHNDASDTLGGGIHKGTTIYRIYLDLAAGNSLRSIYGNNHHKLKIESTKPFFNNEFRGKTFGYQINKNNLDNNSVALDSWLTMGFASNSHFGVPKTDDPDTSIVGGVNNDGGSAMIPVGLLINDDEDAGIALTIHDGLVYTDSVASGFFHNGFIGINGEDYTIFGSNNEISSFESHNVRLINTKGILGPMPENKILIAQLATEGTLSFELNIEVIKSDGRIVNYVSSDPIIGVDTFYNSWLKYPFSCGCTDPDYLEYSKYAASDDGSCKTPIQFGCMDPSACNYDALANWHIPELCCFNSECALKLESVCPETVYGCTDPGSFNYNPLATIASDIDTCCYIAGCMDNRYLEYNPDACFDDGSQCRILKIEGCMDFNACNYNPFANISKPDECLFGCNDAAFTRAYPKSVASGMVNQRDVEIFPNPVNDNLSIVITVDKVSSISYEIIDTYGRTFFRKSAGALVGPLYDTFDLSGFPQGIYFIKVYSNDWFISKTIIKN